MWLEVCKYVHDSVTQKAYFLMASRSKYVCTFSVTLVPGVSVEIIHLARSSMASLSKYACTFSVTLVPGVSIEKIYMALSL